MTVKLLVIIFLSDEPSLHFVQQFHDNFWQSAVLTNDSSENVLKQCSFSQNEFLLAGEEPGQKYSRVMHTQQWTWGLIMEKSKSINHRALWGLAFFSCFCLPRWDSTKHEKQMRSYYTSKRHSFSPLCLFWCLNEKNIVRIWRKTQPKSHFRGFEDNCRNSVEKKPHR